VFKPKWRYNQINGFATQAVGSAGNFPAECYVVDFRRKSLNWS